MLGKMRRKRVSELTRQSDQERSVAKRALRIATLNVIVAAVVACQYTAPRVGKVESLRN